MLSPGLKTTFFLFLLETVVTQWSSNPGMGKGLANSSTRWRSSVMRDTVSESSSRKDLKLARFPVKGITANAHPNKRK